MNDMYRTVLKKGIIFFVIPAFCFFASIILVFYDSYLSGIALIVGFVSLAEAILAALKMKQQETLIQAKFQRIQRLQETHKQEIIAKEILLHQKNQQMEVLQQQMKIETETLANLKSGNYRRLLRKEWFSKMRRVPWDDNAPEVEIEIKFVFQFLQFLGYDESNMHVRTVVSTLDGSQKRRIEADWVIRDDTGQALLVIEAKAPGKPLTEDVIQQARSYTFRFSAPFYIITNGLNLQIYRLGVVNDTCLVSCETSELAENWEMIERFIEKNSAIAFISSINAETN